MKHYVGVFAVVLLAFAAHSQVIELKAAADAGKTKSQGDRTPLVSYQRPADAPVLPGRVAIEDLQSILSDASDESRLVTETLLSQASILSNALLAIQREAGRRPNFASDPRIRAIGNLQRRLGRTLQPQSPEDVVELIEVTNTADRFWSMAPQSFECVGDTMRAVEDHKKKQQQIRSTAAAIVHVETVLDGGHLVEANAAFQRLQADTFASHFAPAQRYLQSTLALRKDLAAYTSASQMDRMGTGLTIVQQVTVVADETARLDASIDTPLTHSFLATSIATDKQTLRANLDALPAFEFDPKSYRVQPVTSAAIATDMENRLERLTASLRSSGELISLVTNELLMSKVEALFGTGLVSELRSKGARIQPAQTAVANLAAEVQKYQRRLAEQTEKKTRRQREEQELVGKIVNEALILAMLGEEFQRTSIIGYRMKATERLQELDSLLQRNRMLLTPQFWKAVDSHFEQLMPGLTVHQASRTAAILSMLQINNRR